MSPHPLHRHSLADPRHSERARLALAPDLSPELSLTRGRAHEICGPARRSFAIWAARASLGPVLWIRPTWISDHPNPDGMRDWLDPARFLFIHARRAQDLLWSCEEALRSGAVSLVICECPEPPGLTPVRRLHLAAQAGGADGMAPTGLLLCPGDGGAAGVESRWHMAPRHLKGATAWQLERRRARDAPPTAWHVQRHITPENKMQRHGPSGGRFELQQTALTHP